MDQSKLAALSDGPTAATLGSSGVFRSFAKGGTVPSEAQKEAGNYRKDHVRVHGMDLSIETPKGEKRSGKGKDGKPWNVTMPAHYGYIRGTKGADGDHVDAYLGPHPGNPNVHVVDQVDADTGKFDEHKALLGFQSRQHALDHYHRGFSDGRGKDRVGAVTTLPAHKFRSWVEKGRRTRPLGTLRIDRTHDDPYLAGISQDKRTLEIDRRVPNPMVVKGKSFDPAKFLAVHEQVERKHMDAGLKYEPAHRLALKAEKAAVEAAGIDWNGYQEQMHKLAAITQREPTATLHPPTDLFKGPFPRREKALLTKRGDTAPDGVKGYAEGGEVEGDEGVSQDDAIAQGFTPVGVSREDAISQGFTPIERPEYSTVGEMAKRGAQAVLPGLGSIPAMLLGAEKGAELGGLAGSAIAPGPGTAIGGTLGGLAGAAAGGIAANVSLRKLQDWFMDKLGITPDPEKAAAFQQEHPNLATAADIGGSLVGMSPARGAITGVQRATMGAGQAAIEAGSEYLHTGELDPTDIAMAAAAGAAFPGLNKLGAGVASKLGVRVGRPDIAKGGEPLKQLPAPPDYTTSSEGETAAYPGGDDQVFSEAAAPRPGGPQENQRPIYEMPRSDWTDVTRPGTRPPDNTAPGAENDIPNKSDVDIAADKSAATPAHAGYDPNSTLSTSHEMAPPRKDTNIGNPQSYPAGSERDYRTTLDSNVHPTSSGAGDHPTAEILDPTQGSISQETLAALRESTGMQGAQVGRIRNPGFPANENTQGGEQLELTPRGPGKTQSGNLSQPTPMDFPWPSTNIKTGKGALADNELAKRDYETWLKEGGPEPPKPRDLHTVPEAPKPVPSAEEGEAFNRANLPTKQLNERKRLTPEEVTGAVTERQPVGTEVPAHPNTGIVEGAVADTAAKLRQLDMPDAAKHIEDNPALAPKAMKALQELAQHPQLEPQARRILQDVMGVGPKEQPFTASEVSGKEAIRQRGGEASTEKEHPTEATTVTGAKAEDITQALARSRDETVAREAIEKYPPVNNEAGSKADWTRAKQIVAHYDTNATHPDMEAARAELIKNAPDYMTEDKKGNWIARKLKALEAKSGPSPAKDYIAAARKLAQMKRPSEKAITDFQAKEKLLREGGTEGAENIRQEKQIKGEKLNRRTGEEAITAGENETASRGGAANTIEDEMIDRLDEHARLADNMKDLDHEHWMDDGAQITPPKTETSASPTEHAANSQDETGYHNQWEQDAADRAYKAAYQRFGREALKKADPSKIPEPKTLKNVWDDEAGSLNYEKIKQDLLVRAAPIKAWVIRNIMPEMFSQKAQYAEPLFAKRQVQQARLTEQFRNDLDAEWYTFNKMSPYDQVSFMTRYEQGKPQDAPWKDVVADRFRAMLDNSYENERLWGSQAEYVENYMSHIFENEADFTAYKAEMFKRYGPTWFQKHRDFQTINDALLAGYKLKFTNPVEVVTRRLMAGTDMMLKMQLLHELNSMGLAHPIGEKSPNVTGQWQQIGAPNRENWMIAPDVQALWKNGVDAKGLWANESTVGSIFRGWMNLKNIWTPIKMSLSAFHPLHIAAGVLQSDNFARGWSQGGFVGGLKEMRQNIGDPLFAFGKAGGSFHPEFIGKQVRDALRTPWEIKTPWQEEATRWADEGGFKGTMSHEEVVSAKRDFAKAWQENDWTKWIPAAGRFAVEKAMGPIFSDWIPNLKMASYYRSAAAYMKLHPEAVNDPDMRRLALRTIAKQVDNRYGEMFYGGLFWNRYAKDASIGSFLSLGWNLGFAREFGGAGISAVRTAATPYVGPRSMAGRVVEDASSKAAYVSSYVAITMGMAGAMTYALSGQAPTTPMDYIFPRAGGQNLDGSPRRLSTMFYTREPVQALAHIQERGSIGGGLGQMLWNKMVFEPVVEAYNNRDFFGYQLYDPQANWLKQWGQLAGSVLGNAFNPISMSSMERAQQTGGGARDKALAVAGFGPAPAYVSKDALQNRISHLYYQGPGAGEKPYENKARDQERRNSLADLRTARASGDTAIAEKAQQQLIKTGMTPATINRERRGSIDAYQFSRLDPQTQKGLVSQMDDKQFFNYAMGQSPVTGRARLALHQEWQRLHPGKPLPSR